jgi:hypothetical protein
MVGKTELVRIHGGSGRNQNPGKSNADWVWDETQALNRNHEQRRSLAGETNSNKIDEEQQPTIAKSNKQEGALGTAKQKTEHGMNKIKKLDEHLRSKSRTTELQKTNFSLKSTIVFLHPRRSPSSLSPLIGNND